jgi:HD-like signal output (HDOD) protein/CheY-like chemotaxis protein
VGGATVPAPKRILIVDDHAIFREPLKVVLEQHGYRVDLASSGSAAFAALASAPPDLIVLDLTMPGMDGEEFLSSLRNDPLHRAVPVVILSVRTDRCSVTRIARLGVSGYVLKDSFSLDRLLSAIGSALAGDQPRAGAPSDPDSTSGNSRAGSAALSAHPMGARSQPGPTDLRSLNPIMTREVVLRRVAAAGPLRVMSPILSEVLRITEDPKCTIDAAAAVIAGDPAMALRVIALANSSAYSRGSHVESLRRAVVQIGLRNIRQTVLTFGIVDRFGACALTAEVNRREFWEHAYSCAVTASEIAHTINPPGADAAFLAGLLHDLGRAVLADVLGDVYASVLQTARRLQLPLEQVETKLLGLNHAQVMASLLERWGLPATIADPILSHHSAVPLAGPLGRADGPEVAQLIAADRLTKAWMLASSGNDTLYPTRELCRQLGLDAGIVHQIEGRVRSASPDLKRSILPMTPAPTQTASRRGRAPARPLRPLFVGPETTVEAVRIFCIQLAKRSGHGRPNLVVAFPTNSPEDAIANQIEDAERRAGVTNLPVLIVDPTEDSLAGLANTGRSAKGVHCPIAIARLLDVINRLLAGQAADIQAPF